MTPRISIARRSIILSGVWLLMVVASGQSSQPDSTARELLAQTLDRYGSVDHFRCTGTIKTIGPGFSLETGDTPSGGDKVTINEFDFEFSRNGFVRLLIYRYSRFAQNSTQEPNHVISLNDSGEYTLYTKGKYILSADSLSELATLSSEKHKGLLTFFLDLLVLERHFKLLDDVPKRFAKKQIDSIRYQGLQLKTHQRKTLWIEPDTFLIGQARVVRNKAARDKEIALLTKQLSEPAEHEVESGERLSWQIDELSSFDQNANVFIYDFERQRLD